VQFCTLFGGSVLDVERVLAFAYWDGDLLNFATRASSDESDLAALVVAVGGHARAWVNLRLVHPEHWPLVWLRLRYAAVRGPGDVLFAEDLAPLLAEDDRQASCGDG
jgi:hypothetical protein